MLARWLGGGTTETVAAVLLASIASPVASYALMEFSEPVQAAALTVALTLAFTAATASTPRAGLELAAGFTAGLAVLSKGSLILAAPAVLLPLIDWSAPRRTPHALIRAFAGAAGPLAVWVIFELVRLAVSSADTRMIASRIRGSTESGVS
jgi:4-amino-4-deoxy-L-arabinose transferase-like glycosyltransferase